MIDLKTIKEITISEGSVTKITDSSGVVLWEVKDTGTTAQTPCYYVADNVSDLPSTPKYDMAYITSEKRWYALNNKSQWEKYGVIESVSSLDNLTAYDGKLVYNTTDNHEYKYINNAWSDQGEVKVTQNVPDGYKAYDYIEQPTVMYGGTGATISAFTVVNGCTYNLKYYMPAANYSSSYYGWIIGECDGISNAPIGVYKLDNGWGTNSRTIAYYHSKWKISNSVNSGNGDIPTDKIFNMEFTPSSLIAYDTDGNVITTFKTSTNAEAFNSSVPLIMWGKKDNNYIVSGKLYELSMKDANGNMVNDCVPATETLSGNKGLLDLVTKKFYKVNDNSAVNMGAEKEYNSYTYPVLYEQYDAPNLNYTECANEAAMKALSCPYDGMKVKLTDTGKKYKFTYNSTTSQYEWDEIISSLDVDLNNQWVASTKTLDGYKVYMSNSNHNVNNGYASMKFKFKGMPDFKIWINSYAESSYDYTVAWKLDVNYPTSNPQYNSTGVKANTNGKQYNPTSISNFTEVDYANDGGEHFVVVTYRKDSSVNNNDDRGYVAVKFTLLSTTWVVSSTEFIKKDNKYYERLNEVGTYTGGVTALTGNYKEGNELTVTYKQGPADDVMFVGSNKYYKNYIYVTPKDQEINTGDYVQGDYIGHITNAMYVKYLDDTEKIFTGLTSINSSTDSNIKNAKEVVIFEGITSIDYYAFKDCSHLTSITIPDSVTSIDAGAFNQCSNLESVTIQNSTSKLAYYYQTFEGISSTAKLYVPAKLLSQYKSDSSWTGAFKGGIFAIEKLLSTTWVVSSSEFVKKDDKYYERLNEVGTYEGGVTALTGNYKEGNELPVTYKQGTADDYMIVGSGKYYKNYIYVTPKDQEINTGDYIQGDYIGEATPSMKVTYTDGSEKNFYELTSIENYTDANKSNAKEVIIYNTVTTIGWSAFDGCSKLESATIPNSVTNIKNYAFRGCSKLSSITIPDSVTRIGDYAFYSCSSLTEVTIGSGATNLGGATFDGCTALRTMTVKATNPPVIIEDTIPTTIQTIYVPADSVNDYKSHYEEFDDGFYGWRNFADKIKAIGS